MNEPSGAEYRARQFLRDVETLSNNQYAVGISDVVSPVLMEQIVCGSTISLQVAYGVCTACIRLNVQHDANHGRILAVPRINRVLGMFVDGIRGLQWNQQTLRASRIHELIERSRHCCKPTGLETAPRPFFAIVALISSAVRGVCVFIILALGGLES